MTTARCPSCSRIQGVTKRGTLWRHGLKIDGATCPGSGQPPAGPTSERTA